MIVNKDTVELVKYYESYKAHAYLCPAGKYTVGYGSTFYEDGTCVKKGDIVTYKRAVELLNATLNMFGSEVKKQLKVTLNENQFGALVSLAFNIGITHFASSTLLKKVNKDPNDSSISFEFSRWNKSKGKVLNGLVKRRKSEALLYFREPTNNAV